MFRRSSRTFGFVSAAVVGGLLFTPSDTRADLLYSESFDYSTGSLTGSDGWSNRDDFGSAEVTSPGLDYPGAAADGNKAFADSDAQSFRGLDLSGIASQYKDADGNIGAPGQTLWLSILGQRISDEPAPFFGVSTFLADDPSGLSGAFDPATVELTEKSFVGIGSNETSWKVQGTGVTGQTGIRPADAVSGNVDQLVVRYDFHDDGTGTQVDTAHLFVNPSMNRDGSQPSIADAHGVQRGEAANLHFNALRIGSFGEGNVDEIRLGTTYADVAAAPTRAADPVITNPSFEADLIIGGDFNQDVGYIGSGEAITGWRTSVASTGLNSDELPVFYQPGDVGPIPDGDQVAFFQVNDASGVFVTAEETMVTGFKGGVEYNLSYFENARAFGHNQGELRVGVQIDFGDGFMEIVPVHEVESMAAFQQTVSEAFTATGDTARIQFVVSSDSDETLLLDHLQITAAVIPEPASLSLLGLGGLGLLIRRRRRTA